MDVAEPAAAPTDAAPDGRGLHLTTAGWLVLVAAMLLVAAGRLLGIYELFLIGVAGVVLVVASLALVVASRPRLDVVRLLHPPRVHAGAPSRVDLRVSNRGGRRSKVIHLHDPVSGTAGADLLIAPVPSGATVAASYRLPTDRRGLIRTGPLTGTVEDPFGLVGRTFPVAGVCDLTVLPRVDRILPLPHTVGRDDPHAGADHPNVLGLGGDDFYTLRGYVVGDDLRRVHWPSSARRDQLTVRQDEVPWQGRTTVLLDARHGTTTAESFELAVSAAASVVMASARNDDRSRLVITDGSDTGYADTNLQVENVMERLAVVDRHRGGTLEDLRPTLERGPSGALVVVTSEPTKDDVSALLRLRSRFGTVTVVLIERSATNPAARDHEPAGLVAERGLRILRVTGDTPFVAAWETTRPIRWRQSVR